MEEVNSIQRTLLHSIIIISRYNQSFRGRWEISWTILSPYILFLCDLKACKLVKLQNVFAKYVAKTNTNKLPWQYVTEGINIFRIDLSFRNGSSTKWSTFPNTYFVTVTYLHFSIPLCNSLTPEYSYLFATTYINITNHVLQN